MGLALLVMLVLPRPVHACVGNACINIVAEGGALSTTWDFAARKVQTFLTLCISEECFYSTIDPGFLLGTPPLPQGFEEVAAGTRISLEVVARDPAVTFRLNGQRLEVGDRALIGTAPDLHNHPSWQLTLPEDELGEYALSFKLTTTSSAYGDSPTFTILLSNLPPPTVATATPSPTPIPTGAPPTCAGDCNGDGAVTVDELVRGVGAALGSGGGCAALDRDADGAISINELVTAVGVALTGCVAMPTPTATQPPTLAFIQDSIFSPRCAVPACHDTQFASGSLNLESGRSYAELVGVPPDIETAAAAGQLRVDAGDPANSFLLIKLVGPPPGQGSRMPLTGALLTAEETDLIRAWIAAGAQP